MNTTKAYLAGIGTAGILVAAIAVLLVLGRGLAAFDGLPDLAQKPAPLDRVVLREHRQGAGQRARGATRPQAARRRGVGVELGGSPPGAGIPGDGGPGGGLPGGGSPGGGSPGGSSPGGGRGGSGGAGGGGGSLLPRALRDVTDRVGSVLDGAAPRTGAPVPELDSQPRDAIRR